jgi:hypothetical protein
LRRTAAVLEQVASPEARKVLERLANGPADAAVTREAKAALHRLDGVVQKGAARE